MKESMTRQEQKQFPFDEIQRLLKDMRFGSITLIIQDGRIVQIDKIEKHRIKD